MTRSEADISCTMDSTRTTGAKPARTVPLHELDPQLGHGRCDYASEVGI